MKSLVQGKLKLRWLFVLPVLYLANYLITPMVVGPNALERHFRPRGNQDFDAEVWKSSVKAEGRRYEMVDDLLSEGKLIGMRDDELLGLLGKADMEGKVDDGRALIYVLASQRTFPSKSLWWPGVFMNHELWTLKIRLNAGKVERAWVDFS